MKCDLCKGTGRLVEPWYDTTGAMTRMPGTVCFMCDGKGEVKEQINKTTEEFYKSIEDECKSMCYIRHLAERIESIARDLSTYEDDRIYAKSMRKEIKRLADTIINEVGNVEDLENKR